MAESLLLWIEKNEVISILIYIGITIALGVLLFEVLRHMVNRTFNNRFAQKVERNQQRSKTLNHLINSVLKYLIVFIVFVIIMSRIGINIASILAAAGVVGLAVSFGAQSLIKDIFTGFFIILEDQYNVGEHVIINTHEGIVEELGMRITKIKGFDGELYMIPNGTITDVANYCRDNIRVFIDQNIGYGSDITLATSVMEKSALAYYKKHSEDFAVKPVVVGVQALMESAVTLRLIAYVKPMHQWDVERGLRKAIKVALDEAGIKIPFPVCEIMQMPTAEKKEEDA